MRIELQDRFDFSTYACFSAIVNSEQGGSADKSRITESALGKYLVKNGYYATERELKAVLRRLDIDHDGKVLYADLSEYIKPRSLPLKEEDKQTVPVKHGASLRTRSIERSRSKSKSPKVRFAEPS